jgi:hypothetical protein
VLKDNMRLSIIANQCQHNRHTERDIKNTRKVDERESNGK